MTGNHISAKMIGPNLVRTKARDEASLVDTGVVPSAISLLQDMMDAIQPPLFQMTGKLWRRYQPRWLAPNRIRPKARETNLPTIGMRGVPLHQCRITSPWCGCLGRKKKWTIRRSRFLRLANVDECLDSGDIPWRIGAALRTLPEG